MTTIFIELDNLRESFIKQHLINERNNNTNINDERKLNLDGLISELSNTEIIIKKNKEKNNKEKEDINKSIDIYLYQKKWNKLIDFHKIVKIKEYLKDKYSTDPNLEQLTLLLLNAIDEKKINSVKFVDYDDKKSCIINIPCLKKDENNKYYLVIGKEVYKTT